MPPDRLIPNVVAAVDVVLFTVRASARVDDAWQVLLVQRGDAAFGGHWSLPGVLLRSDETFDEAARRALRSKAGLDARDWYLEQLASFGRPDRDSRGRVVSVAHAALVRTDHLELAAGSDVIRIAWFPVSELPWEELAFDHGDMLRIAIDRVRSKVRYSWVAFQLLPAKFTLPELRAVYAAILERMHHLQFAIRISVAVRQEHGKIVHVRFVFDAADHFSDERIRDAGDDDADRVRAPGGHAARDRAGPEPALFSDAPDLFCRFRIDQRTAGQRPRHRRMRHVRKPGDVFDGDSPGSVAVRQVGRRGLVEHVCITILCGRLPACKAASPLTCAAHVFILRACPR